MHCAYTDFQHRAKLYRFQNISLEFSLKIFLQFRKLQSRYSNKIYFYKIRKECKCTFSTVATNSYCRSRNFYILVILRKLWIWVNFPSRELYMFLCLNEVNGGGGNRRLVSGSLRIILKFFTWEWYFLLQGFVDGRWG